MTTKSAATKTPRSTNKRAAKAKPEAALVPNHTDTLEVAGADAGDMALDDLISSLTNPDEILEPLHTASHAVDEATLNAAVNGAEATELMVMSAAPEGVADGSTPTGDTSDLVAIEPEAAAKPAKKAAVPRKHYTDKTERLKDKLGAGLSEYSVLTLADAEVSDEELVAKMEETMVIIRSLNKKEQNWAVKFIEYLAGKKSSISEVTGTILKLLHEDGQITTGNEGNVFKKLVARPYSPGAARAMGGNNVGMLKDLKLILEDGKGKYIANPDSLLLMKANSMLFAPAREDGAFEKA